MENEKQFKYTMSSNNGLLTTEQREFFETNGFIVIRRLIDETLLDQFKYLTKIRYFLSKKKISNKHWNLLTDCIFKTKLFLTSIIKNIPRIQVSKLSGYNHFSDLIFIVFDDLE